MSSNNFDKFNKNNFHNTGSNNLADKINRFPRHNNVPLMNDGSLHNDTNFNPSDNLENNDDGLDNSKNETEHQHLTGKGFFSKKFKKIALISSITTSTGCFFWVIIVSFILGVFVLPIMYVGQHVSNFINGVQDIASSCLNWLKRGTYCSNDKECQEIEKNDFYEKIIDVYNEYKEKYNVSIDAELITATLTYYDTTLTGFEDYTGDDENYIISPSDSINYKKGEKKIRELAQNMVSKSTRCVNTSTGESIILSSDSNDKCMDGFKEISSYSVDDDKYKKYLKEEFILKYYFNDSKSENLSSEVDAIIREIYSRAEVARYLNGTDNSSDNFISNNVTVNIMDCTGLIQLEQVSLYEYLQGVLYYEGFATNRSLDFLKVQAIISKNYLYSINGATTDNIPTTLTVSNCRQNQVYCSVTDGCSNLKDGKNDNYNTIVTGISSDNAYERPSITDMETLNKIKEAIDSTYNEFVIKDSKFVFTQYRSDCNSKGLVCDATTNILDQKVANEMIENGSSYKEVLAYYYNGAIEQITSSIVGYPLDLKYTTVTSQFSWRIDPVTLSRCTSHNGLDISADGDANIYSIADGVIVKNEYNEVYGNHIVIGHGAYNNDTNTYEFYSLYAHQIRLSKLVSVGDKVKAGQKIGNVGSTGYSTGNHLHIEIYKIIDNSIQREDPETYFSNIELKGLTGSKRYPSKQACLSALGK